MSLLGTENDILVSAVVLFAALYGLIHFALGPRESRKSRFRGYSYRRRDFPIVENNAAHFGRQLQSVMASAFEKRRIMNASEYRTFRAIEDEIASIGQRHRVFAQTCLGEVLQSKDEAAFYSINSKRVDILVVDQGGWPALAVEYQGEGHYQGTAAARDAIKKEALRKAGVRYLEVVPGDNEEQIRRRVREHLASNTPSPVPPSPSPSHSPAHSPPRNGFGLRSVH